MGKESGSTSVSKPIYYPQQQQALTDLLGMSMGHLGGTQAQTQQQAGARQPTGSGQGVFGLPAFNQFAGTPFNWLFSGGPFPFNQGSAQSGTTLSDIFGGGRRPGTGTGAPQDDIFTQLAQAYPGQFTAPLSGLEQQGLAGISGYQPGELYGAGKEQLLQTLKGGYNPMTSPYYQGFRGNLQKELGEATTATRQGFNLGGALPSSRRVEAEAGLQGDYLNSLMMTLGGMYETERGRQLQAVPLAQQLERYPLEVAQQQLAAGAVPRGIEQAELDAQRQDWLRQLQAIGLPLEVALQLIKFSPGGTTTQETGGGLNLDIGGIASLLSVL